MFSKLKKKAKTASLTLRGGKEGLSSGERGRGGEGEGGDRGTGLARHPNKAGSDISSGEEENIASFKMKPDPLATPKRKRIGNAASGSAYSSEAESTSTWPSRRVLAAPDGHVAQNRFERARSPPTADVQGDLGRGRSRVDSRFPQSQTAVIEKSPKQKRHRSRSPAHRKFVYDDEDEEEELRMRMSNSHDKRGKKHVYESHSMPGTPKSRKPRKAPMPPKRTSSLITAESLDSTTTATLSDVMFSSEWTSSSNASDGERTFSGCSVNSGQPIDARQGDGPVGPLSDDYVTMQSLMEEEMDYSCHGDIQETTFPFVSYHGNTMDSWAPSAIFHDADQTGSLKRVPHKAADYLEADGAKPLRRPIMAASEGSPSRSDAGGDIRDVLDGRVHVGRGHLPTARMRSSLRGRSSRARTRFPGEASPVNVRRAAMTRELESQRGGSPSGRLPRHTPQPVYISVVKVDYNAHLCDLYNGQQFNGQQFNGQQFNGQQFNGHGQQFNNHHFNGHQFGQNMSPSRPSVSASSLDVPQCNTSHNCIAPSSPATASGQVSMQSDCKLVPCESNAKEPEKKQEDRTDAVQGMTVLEEDVKPGFSLSDEDQTFPMEMDLGFRARANQSTNNPANITNNNAEAGGNPMGQGPRPRSDFVDAGRVLGVSVHNNPHSNPPLIQVEPMGMRPQSQMRTLDRAPPLGRRILGVVDSPMSTMSRGDRLDGDDDMLGQTVLPEICQGLTDLKLVVTEPDQDGSCADDTLPKQVYDNPSVINVAQNSADGTPSTSGSETAPVPPPRSKRKKSKLKSGEGEDSLSQDSSAHGSSDDLLKFKLELLPDIARDLPPTANTRTDTMCTPSSTPSRPGGTNPGQASSSRSSSSLPYHLASPHRGGAGTNPGEVMRESQYSPRSMAYPPQPPDDDDYQGIAIDDDVMGAVGGADQASANAIYQWELKPVENWDSDDVIEWCQAKGLNDIARMIQGKVNSGAELIELNDMADSELEKLGIKKSSVHGKLVDELDAIRAGASSSLLKVKRSPSHGPSGEGEEDQGLYRPLQPSADDEQLLQQQHEREMKASRSHFGSARSLPDRRMSSSAESLQGPGAEYCNRQRSCSAGDVTADSLFRQTQRNYLQLPLAKWSKDDVLHWLDSAGLAKFINSFATNDVSGRDLAEINMKLLDDIDVRTIEDRELLLSKLYELQHPRAPLLQQMSALADAYNMSNTPAPSTSSGVYSDYHIPHQISPQRPHTRSPSPVSPRYQEPDPRRQSRFKELLGQRQVFGIRARENVTIQVWHDLSGKLESVDVKINEATTAEFVVQRILEEYQIPDDYNLYYLVVCSRSKLKQGTTQELGRYEGVMAVQRQWSLGAPLCFELRARAGSTIRVVLNAANLKPRCKVFKVAPISVADEVICSALRKFKLPNVDPGLFFLLQINIETGDMHPVDDNEVVLDLPTDAFLLCNHDNQDNMLTFEEILPLLQRKQGLKRNSSLASQLSSASGQATAHSSHSLESAKNKSNSHDSLDSRKRNVDLNLSRGDRQKYANEPHPRKSPGHATRYMSPWKQKLPSNENLQQLDQHLTRDDYLELLREVARLKENLLERERESQATNFHRQNHHRLSQQMAKVAELQQRIDELREQNTIISREHNTALAAVRASSVASSSGSYYNNPTSPGHHSQASPGHQHPQHPHSPGHPHHHHPYHQQSPGHPHQVEATGQQQQAGGAFSLPGPSKPSTSSAASHSSEEIGSLEKRLRDVIGDIHHWEEKTKKVGQALDTAKKTGSGEADSLFGELSSCQSTLLSKKRQRADISAKLDAAQKHDHDRRVAQAKSPYKQSSIRTFQEADHGGCLYEMLQSTQPLWLVHTEIPGSEPGTPFGFSHRTDDANGHHVITDVEHPGALMQGDRILEINGKKVFGLSDSEVDDLLISGQGSKIKLVLLRQSQNLPPRARASNHEDYQGLREDLSTARRELTSINIQRQTLFRELNDMKHINEKLKKERDGLQQQLESSSQEGSIELLHAQVNGDIGAESQEKHNNNPTSSATAYEVVTGAAGGMDLVPVAHANKDGSLLGQVYYVLCRHRPKFCKR